MRRLRTGGCLIALTVLAVCCVVPATVILSVAGSSASPSSTASVAGIPSRMMTAYANAAAAVRDVAPSCPGMRWQILAGVATVESHNASGHTITASGDISPRIVGPRLDGSGAGGNTTAVRDTDHGLWDSDTAFDRAVGPFQFLPSTFRARGHDGNQDQAIDPDNADDAALTAALYLCGKGRNLSDVAQLNQALYDYNHSHAYVDEVTSWISQYDAVGNGSADGGLSGRAAKVIQAALSQKGTPYSWGGGGPKGPTPGICCSPGGQDGRTVTGYDCSGLTLYAFAQVGVTLPRLASAQAGVGKRIPAAAGTGALRPGDLVFYGYLPTQNSTIHHVGIYLGNGQMVNAARPGTVVRVDSVASMSDYAGGARIL